GHHLLPLRGAPQPGAPPRPRSAVKLHTKIIIGLVSGASAGIVANAFATGAHWVAWTGIPAEWAADKVQWVGNNIAGPVGQIFLRMLLMTIVPRNPIRAAASLDMLGIIFFSLVFGAALTMLPEEKTQPMVRVLDALGEAIVKIIDFAMRLAPYGVFGLIFVVTSRFGFALLL